VNQTNSTDHQIVRVGPLAIGGGTFTLVAGPCAIESEAHFENVARFLADQGCHLLRGGIFKLRTHPDSFQGLEAAGYEIAQRVKGNVGLGFVSEVTDPRQIEAMDAVADMFQVGSRNMHNYALLKELGKTKKPILLKRGFAGLIKEWLLAAEYVLKSGNPNVILCERGIRTFESATRNTLDLNAVAFAKRYSPFPVLVDPSHGTGLRDLVIPMALASAAAGADGIIVEVHPEPSQALSDGFQALTFEDFSELKFKLDKLLPALGLRWNQLDGERTDQKDKTEKSIFESQIQL